MRYNLDKKIWQYVILIMIVGLVVLYSATFDNDRVKEQIFLDQTLCALIGLGLMYIIGKIDYRKFYDAAYVFYGVTVVLLLWVLIGGRHIMGARRWIEIFGMNFQPAELAKLALILVLGRYFSNRKPTLSFGFASKSREMFTQLLIPLAITLFSALLVFKQPDLGSAILLFGIFLGMALASGIEYKLIGGFLAVCLCFLPFAWHVLKPYQKDRLLVFLNPNIDPLGAGYTIIQSKIAVGSGQIFGKGWLSGTQNQLNFLPERHTDFIFSVLGEEWGFVGAIFLVALYFLLILTSLEIASQVKDPFGTLVALGITTIFTLQVIINIGMVIGVFPVVGITLPFISYGRSSFMASIIMMGFLINLSKRRKVF